MLTEANFAANRKTLGANIRKDMGLTDVQNSDWTYTQRVEFNRRFAAYVDSHPASFSLQDQKTAEGVAAEVITDLDDVGILADLSTFAGAAGDELSAINEAVNPFSASNRKLVLTVVVVAAIAFVFVKYGKASKLPKIKLPKVA